ncbi:MAG: cytochrome c oxidase assembly protein [Bacilli bacterium]
MGAFRLLHTTVEVVSLRQFAFFLAWRPEALVLLILLAASYSVITGPLRERLHPGAGQTRRSERAALTAALAVLFIAVGSPLDEWAQTSSFVAYVAQMLLMTMAIPWLTIICLPDWLWQSLLQIPSLRRGAAQCTRPAVAGLVYNLVAALALLPPTVNASLTVSWIHIALQGLLTLAALCFWWPFVSRHPDFPRLRGVSEFIYIVYATVLMLPITLAILLARTPWYTVYQAGAAQPGSRALLLGAQHAGAGAMLVGMLLVYGTLGLRVLARQDHSFWYGEK